MKDRFGLLWSGGEETASRIKLLIVAEAVQENHTASSRHPKLVQRVAVTASAFVNGGIARRRS